MLAVAFLFMGQFALFTYLRPFLETVTGVSVSTLSLMLLLLGVPGCSAPTDRPVTQKRLYSLLIAMPLVMAAIAIGLIAARPAAATVLLRLGAYRHCRACRLVDLAEQVLPDDAEAGGGLMVAVIQLAITVGASVGGLLFDASSWRRRLRQAR